MKNFRKFLDRQAERADSTRGTLVAVVGGYIIYLGIQMLDDTKSGASSMGMTETLVLMCVMILAGALVFAFGAFLFWSGWKRERANIPGYKTKEKKKMKVYSVYDAEFAPYGKVLEGYDTAELIKAMNAIEFPDEGVSYEPGIASLEACAIFEELSARAYGGMPIELGMCWGHNTKLNCLEWHKDSEINIGAEDFILLLAKEEEIIDGKLDTACVKAFKAPAGAAVEVYATALHYAPCHVDAAAGFRTAVVLPKGTNTEMPAIKAGNFEDKCLWARNKWLIAHPESSEAASGAYIGLTGENIDIA